MHRRLLLVLLSFFCLNLVAVVRYSQIKGSVLGNVAVTASIAATDTVPPIINYISPQNLQQNVPADADINLEISDSYSGVDITTLQININGVIYLSTNPQVIITGSPPFYTVIVHPSDPLYLNQVNTVTTTVSDLVGNSSSSTIAFNQPAFPYSTPTPGPTSTPTPSSSPSPTPSLTTTRFPTPTSTTTSITPTLSGPTPTGSCRPPIACPVCPKLTPTKALGDTGPDLSPPEISFIKPQARDEINLTPSATVKISDSKSGVDLKSIKIILHRTSLSSSDPEFTVAGDSSVYTITTKFNQSLTPNTEYFLIVFASDLAGNRLTKSIPLKTKNPLSNQVANLITQTTTVFSFPNIVRSGQFLFPLLFLLFIIAIIFYFINLLRSLNSQDGQPLGIVFNSLTHEPICGVSAVLDHRHHLTSNIFGIFAFKLKPGQHTLQITNPNFAFPSKAHLKKLNFPHPYTGQSFAAGDYLDIPLDPYKNKTLLFRFQQLFLPHYGLVTNSSGIPQSGIEIGLREIKFNSLVATRISDSLGRYRFLIPHGHYQLVLMGSSTVLATIDTRHRVGGYTTINQRLILR